jgi:L,D-peptidoglycan transpeptidase YkuD (ErfK/YbiS/YcfS/YnhG family)
MVPTAVLISLAAFALLAPAANAKPAPGARFVVPRAARQLLVVSSQTLDPPKYLATFRAYSRVTPSAPWRQVFPTWRAETGFGHLRGVRHEGDGSTPTGVFGIGSTIYGNQPDPGELHYGYHRLVCGDWWVEDPFSRLYNRFVHVACGARPSFASGSEPLWTETLAYPYFAVIRFNMQPVRRGPDAPGSGIFLHSWVRGPTAGCVALREPELLAVLRWLRPTADPVIEIGTDREIRRGRSTGTGCAPGKRRLGERRCSSMTH